jgi:putative FmdB family regulatory protein
MTEWNYTRCVSCGHETETMQFISERKGKSRCPKCGKSLKHLYLGYPVRGKRGEYAPEPDFSGYVRFGPKRDNPKGLT